MPQLALAHSLWEGYDALEKPIKAGVHKAMEKFQKLTVAELYADKGLHLEAVENARDPRMRTIRLTDFWRGVVLAPDDGSDTFLLLKVVPHDDAYSWAAKRLFSLNTATRGLEVRNVVAIEQLTPALEKSAAEASALLFSDVSDTVLRDLGIDGQVRRAVRTITSKAQLEAFGSLFPEDQFEVLQYLAEGFSPEEVYRDIVAERRPADAPAEPVEDLATAIANTASRITLVSSPDELAEILSKPFAAWRVFLHPSQRRVAYRPSHTGPAQVTGGPGTGKTVAALHRVKHLLSRSPDTRVLLTTFTNALAQALRENLALLLDGDAESLARVDVTTVNAVAYRIVQERDGRVANPIGDADERAEWRRVRAKLSLPWTEQFLAQEYRHVVLAHDIRSAQEYLAVDRRGRGTRLAAAHRARVWQAIEDFRAALAAKRSSTHLEICTRAARLLTSDAGGGDTPGTRYDHVVVDEAQDLHPAQWRVVRALAAPGPDDLFLTGDPHQRIYDTKVSLASLGIPVTGRSTRLRVNYRSTQEILRWTTAVMDGVPVAELGGDAALDTLTGYRSLLRGAMPGAAGFPSVEAEVAALAERVEEWLRQGVPASEIAVCTRFNVLLGTIRERFQRADIPTVWVKDNPGPDDEGVRLATMHAMKGLEFRCVAVAGVTDSALPFGRQVTPAEVDGPQHESDLLRERCLLFVACTRAREALHVSWHGKPSRFLPTAVTH